MSDAPTSNNQTIGMLNEGRLIALGTPEEVRHSPEPVVRQFLGRNLQLPPLATETEPS